MLRVLFEQHYNGTGKCYKPAGRKIILADQFLLPQSTLRANPAFPERPDAYTDADYRQALRQIGLDDLIDTMNKEKTFTEEEIFENNTCDKLSADRRQLLICARVLLMKPDVVAFNESFSALDSDL